MWPNISKKKNTNPGVGVYLILAKCLYRIPAEKRNICAKLYFSATGTLDFLAAKNANQSQCVTEGFTFSKPTKGCSLFFCWWRRINFIRWMFKLPTCSDAVATRAVVVVGKSFSLGLISCENNCSIPEFEAGTFLPRKHKHSKVHCQPASAFGLRTAVMHWSKMVC